MRLNVYNLAVCKLLLLLFIVSCNSTSTENSVSATVVLKAVPSNLATPRSFESYAGGAADISVNNGPVQTIKQQKNAEWTVSIEGVVLNQTNTLEVEWYILDGESRYTIATQSGSFIADESTVGSRFNAPYESDAFDHDADGVSNLAEVNAGGFPVPEDAIPEVIDIVAPGTFTIGSPVAEHSLFGFNNEVQAQTSIVDNYAIGKYEVTFRQFAVFASSSDSQSLPPDNSWGGGNIPVTNITWNEAHAYTQWLTAITGESYRLPTEAEWEYAARGGTTTAYSIGDSINGHRANFKTPVLEAYYFATPAASNTDEISVFRDEGERAWSEAVVNQVSKEENIEFRYAETKRDETGIWLFDSIRQTVIVISPGTSSILIGQDATTQDAADLTRLYEIIENPQAHRQLISTQAVEVGSFVPNAYGLYDVHGNVYEWTCSHYQAAYIGAEKTCVDPELADTSEITMSKRGGSWKFDAKESRSANRGWNDIPRTSDSHTGLRVVRTVE